MAAETAKKKNVLQVLLSRSFLTLFVCYIFACLSFSCAGSVFVRYGTEELALDPVVVGGIAGMVSMIGLIMRPITAVLVDKFNRKYMLILAYLLLTVSYIVLVFAKSVPGLNCAQIIRGVAWAINNSAGFIMVGEVVDKDDLGTAMSVYSLAQVIASSFSAVLILAVANAMGYRAGFVMTAVFGLISAVLAMTIPYTSKINKDETLLEGLKKIRFGNLFSIQCAPILVITFTFQFISIALGASWVVKFGKAEMNIANAGLYATISNVIMYFTKPFFGKVMDQWGARWCVLCSGLGYAAACLVMANAQSLTMFYISAVILGVFTGGNAMAGRTMAMKSMPYEKQAVASSTVGIGNDIGMTLANMAIPALAAAYGTYRTGYAFFAGLAVATVVYAFIYGAVYVKRHPSNEMNW